MAKNILTMRDLGADDAWLLLQQANGIPDPRERSRFMDGRTAGMWFAEDDIIARLCVTGAVRQMGGQVVFISPGKWIEDMNRFPIELTPIFQYYIDCAYICGIDVSNVSEKELYTYSIPIINLGCREESPARALADLTCILRLSGQLKGKNLAWIGTPNGTLYSIMQAAQYFDFSIRLAVPRAELIDKLAFDATERFSSHTIVTNSIQDALKGADYICVGCDSGFTEEERNTWALDDAKLKCASDAYLMFSAQRIAETLPVPSHIMEGSKSLVVMQAENRLRIHKRMLHWVFDEN